MFRMFAEIFRPQLRSEPIVPVDEELKKYADSLEAKRKAAIERMGDKWVLHPKHQVKKQDLPANTLGFK